MLAERESGKESAAERESGKESAAQPLASSAKDNIAHLRQRHMQQLALQMAVEL